MGHSLSEKGVRLASSLPMKHSHERHHMYQRVANGSKPADLLWLRVFLNRAYAGDGYLSLKAASVFGVR